MVYWRKVIYVGLVALVFVANPIFTALAQNTDDGELQVHITQIDSSDFPSVTVYVSVTDSQGEPVGVEPERLVLQENGLPVHLDQIQGLGKVVALTTLLVFDVSGSMNSADKLETAKDAAQAYVEQMRPGDQVGLLTFNTTVTYVQPITTDQAVLKAAIDSLIAEEDTAMYDALVEAVDLLATISGRVAIIVLTDGMDNRSTNALEDVIEHIGPAGLSISTVGLGDPEQHDATTAGLDVPALEALAAQAGGEYAYANDPESLTALYERYARMLQSEYVITYTSPGGLRDGLTRQLTVTLADIEIVAQGAAYNPGGLVPEVGKPASGLVFLSALGGLIVLLFLPSVVGRWLALFSKLRSTGLGRRKSRIRFKDK